MIALLTALACGPKKALQPDPAQGIAPAEVLDRLGDRDEALWVERTGAAPRHVRLYEPVAGTVGATQMAMDMDYMVGVAGIQVPMVMPRLVWDFDHEITQVDGPTFQVRTGFRSAAAVERAGSDDSVVGLLQDTLSVTLGMESERTVTRSGRVTRTSAEAPDGASPEALEQVELANGSLDALGLVLPDEAIGVGAAWTRVTRAGDPDFPLVVVTRQELVGVSRDVLDVRLEIAQFRLDADATPDLDGAVEVQVLRFQSTGKGAITQSLREPWPEASYLSLSVEMDLLIDSGDGLEPFGSVSNVITSQSRLP